MPCPLGNGLSSAVGMARNEGLKFSGREALGALRAVCTLIGPVPDRLIGRPSAFGVSIVVRVHVPEPNFSPH